ncbi:MAG: hypothetical protein KAI93_17745, partial [Desulfobacterales bacterium]|nr:hypothetical protein [Desulfobacterales bacterium]
MMGNHFKKSLVKAIALITILLPAGVFFYSCAEKPSEQAEGVAELAKKVDELSKRVDELAKKIDELSEKPAISKVKNPDTFILANYGNLRTLDPSVAYDVTSSQRLWNIYQTLIFFDGSHTDKFTPLIATQVPALENGGISKDGKTYTFTIRKGIKFHEGGDLTPEDVVYSFKRNMIVDQDGGPMWMLLEALTGEGSTRDKEGKIIAGIFDIIDKCVEAKGDKVIFHLPKPYPPFMGILAYSSSVVMDKEWA